jgi:hypothetical protein
MTDLEKRLLFSLADMVAQNCDPEKAADGSIIYETGFIRCHKESMQLLVKCGVMEEIHDGFGRNYSARFIALYPYEAVKLAIKRLG